MYERLFSNAVTTTYLNLVEVSQITNNRTIEPPIVQRLHVQSFSRFHYMGRNDSEETLE